MPYEPSGTLPVEQNPFARTASKLAQLLAASSSNIGAFGTTTPQEEAARPRNVLDNLVSGAGKLALIPGQALNSPLPLASEDMVKPAADLAGALIGGGMPMAERGAAGIFGGRLAQTADHAALAKAEEMAGTGADRHTIWNETGWFQGPDKKWRFEIPDDALSVRKGYGAGLEYGAGESWGRFEPKIEHQDLTSAYPGKFDYLAHDVKVARNVEPQGRFMPEGAGRNEEFYYSDKPVLPTLFVESPTTKQARSITAHELQHAVQEQERFAPGANPDMFYLDPSFPKFEKARESQITDEVLMDHYRRTAGEVEARNVQNRLNFTPEQRRATPPWQTQDVPDINQIIRNGMLR